MPACDPQYAGMSQRRQNLDFSEKEIGRETFRKNAFDGNFVARLRINFESH
jgi:hypothetical protein